MTIMENMDVPLVEKKNMDGLLCILSLNAMVNDIAGNGMPLV